MKHSLDLLQELNDALTNLVAEINAQDEELRKKSYTPTIEEVARSTEPVLQTPIKPLQLTLIPTISQQQSMTKYWLMLMASLHFNEDVIELLTSAVKNKLVHDILKTTATVIKPVIATGLFLYEFHKLLFKEHSENTLQTVLLASLCAVTWSAIFVSGHTLPIVAAVLALSVSVNEYRNADNTLKSLQQDLTKVENELKKEKAELALIHHRKECLTQLQQHWTQQPDSIEKVRMLQIIVKKLHGTLRDFDALKLTIGRKLEKIEELKHEIKEVNSEKRKSIRNGLAAGAGLILACVTIIAPHLAATLALSLVVTLLAGTVLYKLGKYAYEKCHSSPNGKTVNIESPPDEKQLRQTQETKLKQDYQCFLENPQKFFNKGANKGPVELPAIPVIPVIPGALAGG